MPAPHLLDPTSQRDYRLVLGQVPTSVAIVTGISDGVPVGVSVGSFTSVYLEPPLVGFFITATSSTWPRIEPTGSFCVSILNEHQEALCRVFATRGADKFAGCDWSPTQPVFPSSAVASRGWGARSTTRSWQATTVLCWVRSLPWASTTGLIPSCFMQVAMDASQNQTQRRELDRTTDAGRCEQSFNQPISGGA